MGHMAGQLVVEGECPSAVADLDLTAHVRDPPDLGDRAAIVWRRQSRCVRREGGIAPQHVLDVHDEQLLVLLLVVQPELDQLGEIGSRRG
jgi:hypothetical protein